MQKFSVTSEICVPGISRQECYDARNGTLHISRNSIYFLELIYLTQHMYSSLVSLITVRNSSCEKVMFSQACVKNSVHGGRGCLPGVRGGGVPRGVPARGVCIWGGLGRPPKHYGIWSTSGWYASHWNAFFL